jgi:hypothetical protein
MIATLRIMGYETYVNADASTPAMFLGDIRRELIGFTLLIGDPRKVKKGRVYRINQYRKEYDRIGWRLDDWTKVTYAQVRALLAAARRME